MKHILHKLYVGTMEDGETPYGTKLLFWDFTLGKYLSMIDVFQAALAAARFFYGGEL